MAETKGPQATRAPPVARRSVARGYTSLQKRLKVGASNDRYEREADRIANHVVGPSTKPVATPPPPISPLIAQRMPVDDMTSRGPEEPAQRRAKPSSPETPDDDKRVQRMTQDDMPETAQMMRRTGPEAPAEDPSPPKTASPSDTGHMAQRSMRGTGPEAPKDDSAGLLQALTAQREASPGATGGAAPAGVERAISRMRGATAPGLDPGMRRQMEDKIGVHLGNVRVHASEAAAEAADGLNAKAFTVGQDMFFGRGQYDPGSTEGRRLIAHETAHTVQQLGGTAAAQRVQRATAQPAAPKSEIATKSGEIDLTTARSTVVVNTLELPFVDSVPKGFADGTKFQPVAKNGTVPAAKTPYTLAPPGKRPSTKASDIWTDYAKANASKGAKAELQSLINATNDVDTIVGKGNKAVYAVMLPKSKKAQSIMLGTLDELSKNDAILRPQFNQKGVPTSMDADHILEWQMGGDYGAKNLQLLEAKFNQRVGRELNIQINERVNSVLTEVEAYKSKNKDTTFTKTLPKNAKDVRTNWDIKFKTIKGAKGRGSTGRFWSREALEQGQQVKMLKALTAIDMKKLGFKPGDGETKLEYINVFPSPEGGRVTQFKVSRDGSTVFIPDFFYNGIEIMEVVKFSNPLEKFDDVTIIELKVRHKVGKKKRKKAKQLGQTGLTSVDFNIGLHTHERLGLGVYVSRQDLTNGYREALRAEGLSPIVLDNAHIDSGGIVRADGNILATKALFPGLKIPLTLAGDEVYIDFPIPAGQISLGPVKITDPTIKVGYGKNGIFLSGGVGLEVDQVGKGALSVKATQQDMLFKGNFVFDFDFVEKAELKAEYSVAKDALKVNGQLVMKKGTLPGVESGKIDVAVTRETFGLTGTFQLGGLLAGSVLTVGYTPKTGFVVEGKDLPLPVDKLPGVSDAKVTVKVRRSPEGIWLVSGEGNAALKAPGASGKLGIKMKGEAFKFDGRVDLAKGPAKGYIQVTATNMALDDKGEPIEGGPIGELQIWGKGSASIAFGKVLTGTAGIEYTKDGRIIISGEIALPPTVDLFKKKEFNKRLVTFEPPSFPIWGIEIGPFGVGVFAFVDARVDFLSSVGPGQLRDTKVNAVMDLDEPEEAQIEGKAKFHIPAYAGFKLDLGGGLKAQVTVAYVKGRVGLDGTLGLGAEASLDVGVKWNPKDGFEASALAEVKASPKFELGVNAEVTAGADLVVKEVKKTWGPWRKKLGEFGPNMELKASFPVKYTDKSGLDLDLSKIEVTKPKLDAKALMKDAFKTLV